MITNQGDIKMPFDYPLKDALQELVWDFQKIGQEFLRDIEALEPEIEKTFDDIEAENPDMPLEDAIIKTVIDELNC